MKKILLPQTNMVIVNSRFSKIRLELMFVFNLLMYILYVINPFLPPTYVVCKKVMVSVMSVPRGVPVSSWIDQLSLLEFKNRLPVPTLGSKDKYLQLCCDICLSVYRRSQYDRLPTTCGSPHHMGTPITWSCSNLFTCIPQFPTTLEHLMARERFTFYWKAF